ncbi:MAG: DUF2996 domain-containing protein [Cyanothece sp. SIO1E1]|nr:DUF2996 domain-containing protein [Cyanothece sp. SIO1E1]
MAEETTPNPNAAQAATADPAAAKPAAAGAKAKKPPPIEKKPFSEFIQQHYLPSLDAALKKQGLDDVELAFEKRNLKVLGLEQGPECWQVIGQWQKGKRSFNVAFLKEDIGGQKFFSYADNGTQPSTLEHFMVDERRVTLDLMVLYVLQRLNGQKWLVRN